MTVVPKVLLLTALPLLLASTAAAQSSPADAGAAAMAAAVLPSACVEHIPEGKVRPALVETFPERAKAGYAAPLRLEIQHGLGESVLPGGFKLQLDSPEGKALTRAQFLIPALDGPAAPRITRTTAESGATTTVELSFVPLPKEAGPHTLTLPSVPIAIARASGELLTLCTAPHELRVEDPTANLVQATPRPNPAPRSQLEVWTAAKNVALGALIALPLGALIAFLLSRWLRRKRPLPPPPPPRPAWERALEALATVRGKRLIEQGLTTQHFAEVSQAVRDYLGQRYGFDGLESTTREILAHLAPMRPEASIGQLIERLLRRADLVKFANLTPERAECEIVLEDAESIVRRTMAEEKATTPEDAALTAALQAAAQPLRGKLPEPPESPPQPPPVPGARP
ncbi:MAG: hypothetical protein RL033_7953 [Pseudomonadota bacterium]|jgi:hypothetical protein